MKQDKISIEVKAFGLTLMSKLQTTPKQTNLLMLLSYLPLH